MSMKKINLRESQFQKTFQQTGDDKGDFMLMENIKEPLQISPKGSPLVFEL